jgi:uncharacterized circularly permuted ATP-grasp superfamily protein
MQLVACRVLRHTSNSLLEIADGGLSRMSTVHQNIEIRQNSRALNPLEKYNAGPYFCELSGSASSPKPELRPLLRRLGRFDPARLAERAQRASRAPLDWTIEGADIAAPHNHCGLSFDVIPRALTPADWRLIETGVRQRVCALNQFLWDIYHEGHILKDGTLPSELVLSAAHYFPAMTDYDPPARAYTHVAGTGLIRNMRGEFLVLEHNCRAPAGVCHVIENRRLMQRAFRDVISGFKVAPVDDYASRLAEKLGETAPSGVDEPNIVILSAGASDPAYFEHVYLSREMSAPLVEGRDLVVDADRVFMKTVAGLAPVHIIYRRLNDRLLEDPALGVPGLLPAVHKGAATLANAAGAGVADDRAIYAYTPRIIRYYLGEDPILPNVETHLCRDPKTLAYTLDNLPRLIVKSVNGSAGCGVCAGPLASKSEIELWRDRIREDPARYIAQPVIDFSVCPTLAPDGVEPRRVDLRPFAITGEDTWVLPGGLTRVAPRKDSNMVNLAKGGGAKDTWVLKTAPSEEETAH